MGACCYDFEPSYLEYEIWRTARKEHKCCECYKTIKPGDTYQNFTMLSSMGWESHKTCEPCADLRDSLMQVSCPYFGGLKDTYIEYLDEIGAWHWSDDEESIIYHSNYFGLNDA